MSYNGWTRAEAEINVFVTVYIPHARSFGLSDESPYGARFNGCPEVAVRPGINIVEPVGQFSALFCSHDVLPLSRIVPVWLYFLQIAYATHSLKNSSRSGRKLKTTG